MPTHLGPRLRGDDRHLRKASCAAYTAGVTSSELPLFPLRTVLFPGGQLRLRIFEPRYLDLVKQCTRSDSGFGVCLILDGQEAGAPATPAAFGTRARIVDFYSQPDGLLGLQVCGESRFHVLRTRVRDNGLIVAHVENFAEPPPQPVAPEHGLLSMLLERLIERFGGDHAQAARSCFDDAAWVGYRLAEMLPFSDPERQELLQCADQHARLCRIVQRLPQFQT
jgi:Lon protease-like protein